RLVWLSRQVCEGCVAAERGRSARRSLLDACERVDERRGPGPVVGEAENALPSSGDDGAGDVKEAVAQPPRFGAGEFAVEDELAGPCEQVLGDEHRGEPCLVDLE